MPIYLYETIRSPVRQFEVQQSIHDDALTADPMTGEAARRLITGCAIYIPGKSMGPSVGSVGHH
ncbi:MAG: zinc ribbon domain-containing protein [Verrucomicrobiota bacterium]|nr:zinc ribbon domain-containing protein [Verrucomicrobiota bacterium]